jgi:hypothetical protein
MKNIYILVMMMSIIWSTPATESAVITEKEQLKSRMYQLSNTMKKGGSGGQGYAELLMPNFTRWTVGSEIINNKSKWVKGINDWFDSGWRVSESHNDILEIRIFTNLAFTRRIVTETYLGPNNEKNIYRTGVVETWLKEQGNWFLLNASVTPEKLE